MTHPLARKTSTYLAVALGILLALSPHWQTARAGDGVVFEGLLHTPVEMGQLNLVNGALEVSGFGMSGDDGVAIDLESCETCPSGGMLLGWGATFEVPTPEVGSFAEIRLLSGAEVISQSRFSVVGPDEIFMETNFRDATEESTLLVEAFLDEILVGSVLLSAPPPTLSQGSEQPWISPLGTVLVGGPPDSCMVSIGPSTNSENYSWGIAVDMDLEGDENGPFLGNRIRQTLFNPVPASGPLTDVLVVGAGLSLLRLLEEEVESLAPIFTDGFESGDTSSWPLTAP